MDRGKLNCINDPFLFEVKKMCGIIGYTGEKDCGGILIKGLKQLEYRGYDSCGIAVVQGGKIDCEKQAGRVSRLENTAMHGKTGIGHTR